MTCFQRHVIDRCCDHGDLYWVHHYYTLSYLSSSRTPALLLILLPPGDTPPPPIHPSIHPSFPPPSFCLCHCCFSFFHPSFSLFGPEWRPMGGLSSSRTRALSHAHAAVGAVAAQRLKLLQRNKRAKRTDTLPIQNRAKTSEPNRTEPRVLLRTHTN